MSSVNLRQLNFIVKICMDIIWYLPFMKRSDFFFLGPCSYKYSNPFRFKITVHVLIMVNSLRMTHNLCFSPNYTSWSHWLTVKKIWAANVFFLLESNETLKCAFILEWNHILHAMCNIEWIYALVTVQLTKFTTEYCLVQCNISLILKLMD